MILFKYLQYLYKRLYIQPKRLFLLQKDFYVDLYHISTIPSELWQEQAVLWPLEWVVAHYVREEWVRLAREAVHSPTKSKNPQANMSYAQRMSESIKRRTQNYNTGFRK